MVDQQRLVDAILDAFRTNLESDSARHDCRSTTIDYRRTQISLGFNHPRALVGVHLKEELVRLPCWRLCKAFGGEVVGQKEAKTFCWSPK